MLPASDSKLLATNLQPGKLQVATCQLPSGRQANVDDDIE